jgi:hypothetical protein
MSSRPNNAGVVSIGFYFVVIVALFMAMFELMCWSRETSQPAPIDGIRAGERAKALAGIRKSAADQLENYKLLDETKGQVRVPIRRAMELVVQEWADPAKGRTHLIAEYDRFNPPPPPPAPEKPSEFE